MTFLAPTFAQFIAAAPIGVVLSHEEREAMLALSVSPRHYRPHTPISRQGDVEPRVFFIQSGWACVYRDLPSGDRQIIDVPLKGDVIGIRAALGPNYNSLGSITDLSVYEISRSVLTKAVLQMPVLSRFFMRVSARQYAIVTEHLTNTGRRNAMIRTAHYLQELGARLAAIGEGNENGYECPLTQHELADVLGLTAIHVHRTLRELRENELVSFRAGVVEFLNRQKLSRLTSFDGDYLRMN